MDGYEKTPTLGLNKPKKGDFDWDLPLNENWNILDRVGGAQLPLLATIDLDYKLSGDAAIGWALQGSTLSGNTYTSLWSAMKAAYDRSVAANETHYGKTYSVKIDAVTGWRFVTTDVYNGALSALGDSLGHVLDTKAKTIYLRASWHTYDLPTQDTRYIGYIWDETLPNVKGEFYVSNVVQDVNGQQAGASKTKGMFKFTQTGGTTGAAWNPAGGIFTLNASTLNTSGTGKSPYTDNAWVRPQSKNLLRYYKVGNTITNVENIDVGTILDSISDMVHANEFVETKRIVTATWRSGTDWYTKYSDGWIEQGGDITGLSNTNSHENQTKTLHTPFATTTYHVSMFGANSNNNRSQDCGILERKVNQFRWSSSFWYGRDANVTTFSWYACGY